MSVFRNTTNQTRLLTLINDYNWQRPHGAFKGKTSMGVICEHIEITPIWDAVLDGYNLNNERIQVSNYQQGFSPKKVEVMSMNHTDQCLCLLFYLRSVLQ